MTSARPDAREAIRSDLLAMRNRRAVIFATLSLAGIALAVWAMLVPPPAGAMPRDLRFPLAVSLLLAAILLSGSVALGFPLWQKSRAVTIAAIASLAAAIGALVMADFGAEAQASLKLKCLPYAAAVGVGVLVLIRIAGGRVWRRFPDSTWCGAIAGGATAFTILAAHCERSDFLHLALIHLPALPVVYLVAALLSRARTAA